jgi:hypothetical protein
MTMPSTISSTIAGSRTRGKNPSVRGASRPTATIDEEIGEVDSGHGREYFSAAERHLFTRRDGDHGTFDQSAVAM